LTDSRSLNARRINWPIWVGFLLSVAALASYPLFFAQFPVTRDFPWANLLMFAAAALLLAVGLRRSFSPPARSRGKITGPILTVASTAAMGFFVFLVFFASRGLPESHGAPRVGQKAPDFTLPDINGKPISLTDLLAQAQASASDKSEHPRSILLIFYRGYW
jgi:hypothetical protein